MLSLLRSQSIMSCGVFLFHFTPAYKKKRKKTHAEVDSSSCPSCLYIYININLKEETKCWSCESCRHSVRWFCPRAEEQPFHTSFIRVLKHVVICPQSHERSSRRSLRHTVWPAALITWSRGQIATNTHCGDKERRLRDDIHCMTSE